MRMGAPHGTSDRSINTDSMRGGTGLNGETRRVNSSTKAIPDYIVAFEVAPRNLNLTR